MPRPIRRRRIHLGRLNIAQSLELSIGPSARATATGRYAFGSDDSRRRAIEAHRGRLPAIALVWIERYSLPPTWAVEGLSGSAPSRADDPRQLEELEELDEFGLPATPTNGHRGP